VWGYVKNAMYGYTGQVANLDELALWNTAAFETGTSTMLRHIWATLVIS
jgi:hypothetical protein